MEISQVKRDEILRNAEILMLKTECLIQTCDGWLSPEEGLKNVAQYIMERDKAKRKNMRLARWARLTKILTRLTGLPKITQSNS